MSGKAQRRCCNCKRRLRPRAKNWLCRKCDAARADRIRKERQGRGVCDGCGVGKIARGRSKIKCVDCLNKRNVATQRRRKRWGAAGKCVVCGRHRHASYLMCLRCRKTARPWKKAWYERSKEYHSLCRRHREWDIVGRTCDSCGTTDEDEVLAGRAWSRCTNYCLKCRSRSKANGLCVKCGYAKRKRRQTREEMGSKRKLTYCPFCTPTALSRWLHDCRLYNEMHDSPMTFRAWWGEYCPELSFSSANRQWERAKVKFRCLDERSKTRRSIIASEIDTGEGAPKIGYTVLLTRQELLDRPRGKHG